MPTGRPLALRSANTNSLFTGTAVVLFGLEQQERSRKRVIRAEGESGEVVGRGLGHRSQAVQAVRDRDAVVAGTVLGAQVDHRVLRDNGADATRVVTRHPERLEPTVGQAEHPDPIAIRDALLQPNRPPDAAI